MPEDEIRYISAEIHNAAGDKSRSYVSIGPPDSAAAQQGGDNLKEIIKGIEEFDKWFQYAETI
jgi:hypothetical protein